MSKKRAALEPSQPDQFEVIFFKDDDGSTPLLDWLDGLKPVRAVAKCRVVIGLLKLQGNRMRRPHADFLRDGIYELRTKLGRVRYRLLYFFHGKVIVMTHGFAKLESTVPEQRDKKRRHVPETASLQTRSGILRGNDPCPKIGNGWQLPMPRRSWTVAISRESPKCWLS